MPRSKTEILKDWLQIIAIFIAASWAIYTFYFEKILEPSKYPTFLTINSDVTKVSENEEFTQYKVKLTVLNKSKARECLLASWYEMDAFKLNIDTGINNAGYYQMLLKYWGNSSRVPRYSSYDFDNYKVVNTGKILNEGVWLNPDQEFTQEFVTLIPNHTFEEMRLSLNAITAKDNAGMRAYWLTYSNGSTNPLIIAGTNDKDTITMHDYFGSKKQVSVYFKKYDLSYSFNENEYSLGLRLAR